MKVEHLILREKSCKLVAPTNNGMLRMTILFSGIMNPPEMTGTVFDTLFSFLVTVTNGPVSVATIFLQYQANILRESGDTMASISDALIPFMRPFVFQQTNAMLSDIALPGISFANFEQIPIMHRQVQP